MVSREGSCFGQLDEHRLDVRLPPGWLIVVSRLAPLAFEVLALVDALNVGLNASALQLPTWNGLDRLCVAPNVEVSVDSVASAPQLVGLSRKRGLLVATVKPFSRTGTPLTIVCTAPETITRAVCGSTLIVARVTTLPRLNGPATAGTTIDRP